MDKRGEEVHRTAVRTNVILEGVRYEIRGELAARAVEMERQGYEVISLNWRPGRSRWSGRVTR